MSNYRVVIRGVLAGHSAEQVARELARFSKKAPDKLQALLTSGRPVLAKRTPDMQPALRYKKMLEQMGCACRIDAEVTLRPSADANDNAVTALTGLTTSHSSDVAPARDFRYQKAPLNVQLRELLRLFRIRGLTLIVAAGFLLYYGWVNGFLR